MAASAERLPVRFLPEKLGVTLVSDDMIDNGRCSQSPHAIALGTQRIQIKESFPCSPPSGTIAARIGRAASVLLSVSLLRLVLLAPAAVRGNES